VQLIRDIRSKLEPVLGRSYSRQELNDFVVLCHALAVVAVRSRTKSLRYLTRFHFANESDIAYECISDLFRQDEHGHILQLKAYFEGIDTFRVTDEELLAHLRRLIFSKVNFGLYRVLNEADPVLGKILRNIKLATQTLQNFTIIDRFGEQCLAPTACPTLEHLPPPDQKEIEREFHRVADQKEHVPGLFAILSRFLRQQHEARRIVPVMSIALAIKSFYEHQSDSSTPQSTVLDELQTQDTCAVIAAACTAVRRETSRKYLNVKRVPTEDFGKYFEVIRQLLIDRIIERNGEDESLYDRLRRQMPDMTKQQYKTAHRARLEYLVRLTEARAKADLRLQEIEPHRRRGAGQDDS
jgi:hypothetical protein